MKKMIFSASAFALVAVSAISLAPTTASAIPAFARQTGAACLSCHFQEVPALKAFGRAFKMGSFTDVGDQALVEDDNLSIPAVLNASMVVRGDVVHTSGGTANSTTVYDIPADTNFLVAGRIGSNTGAFVEFGGGTGDTGAGFNNFQLMNSWDVGGFKVGLGFADDSFGGSSVLEVSNVFGQHSGGVGDLGGNVGAINNSGFTNSMTSIGAWIGNDLGYVQFALITPGGAAGWTVNGAADGGINTTAGAVDVGFKLAKLVRAVATLDVGGWDTLVGFGVVSGKVGKTTGTTAAFTPEMNMVFVDGQIQGDVGDMSLGVYVDYAHAKGKDNGNILGAQDVSTALGVNSLLGGTAFQPFVAGPAPGGSNRVEATTGYNAISSGQTFDAYSIRATLEPITGITLGAGYGYRRTQDDGLMLSGAFDGAGVARGVVDQPKHQIFSISGSYQLYQNSIISVNFTNDKQSGMTTTTDNFNNKVTTVDWLTLM